MMNVTFGEKQSRWPRMPSPRSKGWGGIRDWDMIGGTKQGIDGGGVFVSNGGEWD